MALILFAFPEYGAASSYEANDHCRASQASSNDDVSEGESVDWVDNRIRTVVVVRSDVAVDSALGKERISRATNY